MRVRRVDADRFVAGAGNREVGGCDGGDISWQAECFVWLLRCGSASLVAGAGNREVARCDGGDISWQAQYTLCGF